MKTQSENRVLLYSFFNLDTRYGVDGQCHAPYHWESDLVPIVQKAGWASGPVWTGVETLTVTEDSIPGVTNP